MAQLFSLRNRRRKGFTLIELLVVISIIAVLIALLLPAVQMARAAARRTQNRNNLKQIGLALHNYHEVYTMFPSGWIGVTAGQPDVEGGNGFSWATMILPQLEQNSVFDKFDFRLPITDPANSSISQTYLPLFRNPSDVGDPTWKIEEEANPGNVLATLSTSNYVGNWGTSDLDACEGLAAGNTCESNGMFYHNSRIRIRDVLDGTSHTFLVGERDTRRDQGWYSTWVGVIAGGEEAAQRVLGVADHTPNHPTSHFDDFGSYDAGGVSFVFADGHVHFVSESVDISVFQGLATRAGSEYVDGDF